MANGSAGASASVVSTAPAAVRAAVQQGIVRVRRTIEQANTAALADAYTKMQARAEGDNRGWMFWAEYHGYNRFDCWHHSSVGSQGFPYDLFLPWHRAYLLLFERTVIAANPGSVLPWWDWTSAASHRGGIPASFQDTPSLESGPVPPALRTNPPRTRRSSGSPSSLPTAATVESILDLTSFDDFSTQVQGQHDRVHGWVGGDMGIVAQSAFDPIFWSHHCMIDRLWYLWQVRHGVGNIPPSYLNRTLAPFPLRVKDVLDIRQLGYSYGETRVRVAADAFAATVLSPAG